MLSWLELASLGGLVVTNGVALLKYKRKPKIDCSFGALPWSIYGFHGHDHRGFRCPKCINVNKNTVQPPICACPEYHREHFHFKCGDCWYQNILKTADDT